ARQVTLHPGRPADPGLSRMDSNHRHDRGITLPWRLGSLYMTRSISADGAFPPPLRGRAREGGAPRRAPRWWRRRLSTLLMHRVRGYPPPQPSPARGEGAHHPCGGPNETVFPWMALEARMGHAASFFPSAIALPAKRGS